MTARSDRAKELLEDPLLQEAFQNVRDAIHRGWAKCNPTDHDAKEEWHRRLFTLDSVEQNLRQAVQDGKYEDFLAEQKREDRKWLK